MRQLLQSLLRHNIHSRPFSRRSRLRNMKIAVEGCCHGELDAIYASLQRLERDKSTKVDLLLIGGDFQVPASPNWSILTTSLFVIMQTWLVLQCLKSIVVLVISRPITMATNELRY